MKKVVSIILIISMMLSLSAFSMAKSTNLAKAPKVTKILLLVAGNLGDKSFNDSSKAGMDLIKNKYKDKVDVKVIELGTDKTKYQPALEDASDQNWDIIITGTSNMEAPMEKVAPQYPDTTYIIFDTSVKYKDIKGLNNVYSITYRQNESGFLAGALAAMVTTSTTMPNINPDKKIGFLGAMDVPVINDFLVGYIEGAKYIDKDTKVDISYIGSFSDAAKGKELALMQYQSDGVDIGFNVAGRAGLGQIDAAEAANRYAIGVDSDQAQLFSDTPSKANKILTSALKRVDKSLLRAVDMYFAGSLPKGKTEVLGLKQGCVALAVNSYYEKNLPKNIKNQMDVITKKVMFGLIKIDSAIGMDSATLTKIKNSAK